MHAQIEPFFDADTCTMTYVVHAGPGTPCAVIDSVLDYDPKSGRTTTRSADRVAAFIEAQDLHIEWLLETQGDKPQRGLALIRQTGNVLEGTIQFPTGDVRYLAGEGG